MRWAATDIRSLVKPLQGMMQHDVTATQGALSRPWAFECNAFGVKTAEEWIKHRLASGRDFSEASADMVSLRQRRYIHQPRVAHCTPWKPSPREPLLRRRCIKEAPMPQSLAKIYLHLVFSTKNREPSPGRRYLRTQCHSYLAGTCKARGSPSLIIGGVADHVHILCMLGREESVAVLIRELKRESSKALKEIGLPTFYWQRGYGAFSVSPSHVDALKNYILRQEAHHRKESFQDEFRRLLKKYGVEYDERYVWD